MTQDIESPHFPEGWGSAKILVAGDIMLNRYIHGEVSRISPEGPFPVVAVTSESRDLGGAGGVYANLRGLGVRAEIVGVIGHDAAGETLKELCGADGRFIECADRPTIVKNRIIGNGAQMMRFDQEKILPLAGADEDRFIAAVKSGLKGADILVLSDYGKGGLTKRGLAEIIASAKTKGIPVFVDPKGGDYAIYRGADVVTPNRRELAQATGCKTETDSDIEAAAHRLLEASGIGAVVATRSEDGMTVMAGAGQKPVHLKTGAREVFDVSGAGDTVIATLAAGRAAGLDLVAAAKLANKAGGIVVGKRGVCVITREELFGRGRGKAWLDCAAALRLVEGWKAQGLKVGFTNGCFDILHAGHVAYLAEAATHCDRLIVALNHDNSVRLLKGPSRPVNDENSRAVVVAGLSSVDGVVLFGAEEAGEDNTPGKIIGYLKPDIIFKGGDYTEGQLPEAEIVRAYGGEVKIMGVTPGKSTSGIIQKISAT